MGDSEGHHMPFVLQVIIESPFPLKTNGKTQNRHWAIWMSRRKHIPLQKGEGKGKMQLTINEEKTSWHVKG